MLSDQNIAEQALRKAMKEFRCGNRQAARYWAHFAVSLAPRMEESWLILAEIAGPRASLEYFKEALRINPESQQARRGVYKIQQRLQKTNEVTSKRPPCPRSDKKDSSSPLRWFGMISAFVLAVVVVVNMYLFISQFEPVKAKGLSANERSVFALQPITTSTMTVTLQPTYTPTATSFPAILPIPNATATPIATPWPATAQTINSPSQPTPTIPSGEKRIIVNIADQHLYAYEGNALIYSFTISTGAEDSTQIGTFFILDKIPQAYSAPWGFWMPDWLGIYWVGDMENGIHALPVLPDGSIIWGDGLGTPISHGCVILNTEDARLLFNWADIGTEVNIIK